jgi:RimJ/RimL family protein N-acetyltransferase
LHEEGLWEASRDSRTWRWLTIPQPQTRTDWTYYLANALEAADAGAEIPLVTICHKEVVGSTRFLALRPEHGSVEIGWTWLHPSAWGTGANVEAKLLQLRHAFEVWGCRRVEFKTDALNERARGALEALGATFEGIHRKHMLVRGGESRDTAWYSVLDDEWPAVRAHLELRLAGK